MPPKLSKMDYVDLKRPTIFAHRGSSAYAPENTLAAFELALEQGADGIELDAKLTSEGQVVIMHDDTVDRTTNGTGRIKAMTLAEIKKLDAGSKCSPKFTEEKVPTLEEVFNAIGGKLFINVELTNYTSPADDLPEKVATLIKKFQLETKVLISSFNFFALSRARTALRGLPVGFLTFSGTANAIFQAHLVRWDPSIVLHPAMADVTPSLVKAVHGKRSRVHAYTVNQPLDMQRLFALGVDGIFTDDPVLAIKELNEYQSRKQ